MSNILKRIGERASAMKKTVLGDRCEIKKKNNLWNNLNSISDKTEKLEFLLDDKTKEKHPNLERDMKRLASYKDYEDCPYDVNLEAAKLVVAHKNASYEVKELGMGDNNTLAYPKYKNWQLAEAENLISILKGDFDKEVYGGKKRKYKRKTNKRKTNKRKTNKRKTNKKRTKK